MSIVKKFVEIAKTFKVEKYFVPLLALGLISIDGLDSSANENTPRLKIDSRKFPVPIKVPPINRVPIKLKISPETLQGRNLRTPVLRGSVKLGTKRKL